MMVAIVFVLNCALMLVQCGVKTNLYSYSDIALKAMGPTGKVFVDIFIFLIQFSFTVAQISYTIRTLCGILGKDCKPEGVNIWWFALGIISIYTPLAMVRKLQKFSFGYILGNVMIIFTLCVVLSYSIYGLSKTGPLNDTF